MLIGKVDDRKICYQDYICECLSFELRCSAVTRCSLGQCTLVVRMLLVRRLGLIRTVLVFGVYHRLQITDPVLGRTLAGH